MPKSISKITQNNPATQVDGRSALQFKVKSKPSSPSSNFGALESKEILRLEYEQLNQWVRHGEEAAHRIFNFYVTLLTAMLGGFILITQLVNGSLKTVFLIGSAVCGLLIIIGVTFLDALIGQYSRNIQYRIGIQRIRNYFRQDPGIAAILSKLPIATLETDSETLFYTLVEGRLPTNQGKRAARLRRLLALMFPVSSQLIFLAMVTSLLVGALVWLLVWAITGIGVALDKMVLASTLVLLSSFLIQNIMVRIALQGPIERLQEVSATQTELPIHGEK
jgi:hypothetical protein